MLKKILHYLKGLFGHRKTPAPKTGKADKKWGSKTAEQLCGVDKNMDKEALGQHLKALYKRHNWAASSLDPSKRAEAETMLKAIVEVRQRYLEE